MSIPNSKKISLRILAVSNGYLIYPSDKEPINGTVHRKDSAVFNSLNSDTLKWIAKYFEDNSK